MKDDPSTRVPLDSALATPPVETLKGSTVVDDWNDVYFDATGSPEKAISDEVKAAVGAYRAEHPELGTKEKPIRIADLEDFVAKQKK